MIECYKCCECLIKEECDIVDDLTNDCIYDLHKMLVKIYNKGRADVIEEIDNLIAEMTEIAESQMMFRHAEICELIRERIKVNMDDSKRINS